MLLQEATFAKVVFQLGAIETFTNDIVVNQIPTTKLLFLARARCSQRNTGRIS